MDVIRLNCPNHILHHSLAPHVNPTHGAETAQCVHNGGLGLWIRLCEEANNTNYTFELDALEALSEGSRTANFDDMIHTNATCEFTGSLTPIGISLVVDYVVRAELL